jgi:hypothetical protein
MIATEKEVAKIRNVEGKKQGNLEFVLKNK